MTIPHPSCAKLMGVEDILLVHRKSNVKSSGSGQSSQHGKRPTAVDPAAALWTTCLRQIHFMPSWSAVHSDVSDDLSCEIDAGLERMSGSQALQFLLEVLCGLHSPVLGETEVLGQFRLFIEQRRGLGDPLFSPQRKWLQFLIAEVKKLRSEFICGLGSNSYGGLVRKDCKALQNFSIFGTGHLALEILPWIVEKNQVQMFSRKPAGVQLAAQLPAQKFAHVQVRDYLDLMQRQTDLGQVLIIAAPLSDSHLAELIQVGGLNLERIFDFRAQETPVLASALTDLLRQQKADFKVSSLPQMFSELAGSHRDNEGKIALIKKVIAERVSQFMERAELRPLGWDDLCA